MEQLYGTRWSDKFGNDPLGKYKDADGKPNPRMEMWIDLVKHSSWPSIKAACVRIRDMPKPNNDQWWMPDAQIFSDVLRRSSAVLDLAPSQSEPKRVIPPWPELACNRFLLQLTLKHGPFSEASTKRLVEAKNKVAEQLNYLLKEGELPKEPQDKDLEDVRQTLRKKFAGIPVEPPSPEETQAKIEAFQRQRGLLPKDK